MIIITTKAEGVKVTKISHAFEGLDLSSHRHEGATHRQESHRHHHWLSILFAVLYIYVVSPSSVIVE